MAQVYNAQPAEPDGDELEPISDAKVSQIIEEFESESQTRRLGGVWRLLAGLIAAALSLYALYWTQFNTVPQVYRASFLMLVLTLTFLFYPMSRRDRKRVTILDVALSLLARARSRRHG